MFGGAEICLRGKRFLVVAGHKGLLSLSQTEVVIRLVKGRVIVLGEGLKVQKMSPSEIYLEGKISSLTLPEEEGAR